MYSLFDFEVLAVYNNVIMQIVRGTPCATVCHVIAINGVKLCKLLLGKTFAVLQRSKQF
jgi:hypothetical protein